MAASEPHTPHPRARLEAVAELNAAGIPTGILVAPLMPGINDDPRQVERILAIAAEAGATSVGGIALHLRGEVRGIFFEWLRSYRPDLVDHYEGAVPAGRLRAARRAAAAVGASAPAAARGGARLAPAAGHAPPAGRRRARPGRAAGRGGRARRGGGRREAGQEAFF